MLLRENTQDSQLPVCGYGWCCVWTGNKNSPKEEWYNPWVVNVQAAVKARYDLKFVVPDDGKLGKGQTLEKKYLDGQQISYQLCRIDKNRSDQQKSKMDPRLPGTVTWLCLETKGIPELRL